MYAGTECYGKETHTSLADGVRRTKYLDWFAGKHPHVVFRMILPRVEDLTVHKFSSKNMRGMFLDELMSYLNTKA